MARASVLNGSSTYLSFPVCGRTFGTVSVTRELVEETKIELAKLRAGKSTQEGADELVDQLGDGGDVEDALVEEVRNGLFEEVEGEASEVVALEQVLDIEDTASDVSDIEADERVGLASVTTEFEGTGVGSITDSDIDGNVLKSVLVVRRTTVPALRHTLLSSKPFERARLASDTKEGLEVVTV